ncbi:4-hydroxy-tetrahydrodipicolinate reductase [Lactobacillus sp. PV012]|uniref:4-hydroxy-tetrahydrodipicolinate reductase n=1 Tax=Lactobacillus sp. PV012 TaxID=2594494 RepID=UPI00223EA1A6|nr:4-hydroxy-tetrahydrodipicolinate reductase [Lactobacillus sp. PV012]QNQ82063.1 4-hydroxy-tetrahydrodipicolinate reductase [Lactobacillus sp. PV012]
MSKKVLIAGYTGSMGQKVIELINSLPDFEISAGLAPTVQKEILPETAQVFTKLTEIPAGIAEIWIDFTVPSSVFENVSYALNHQMKPIVGTTGLTDEQVTTLKKLALDNHLGGLIAPNFGLSAVLLMKFAREAAKYFLDVEIIEMHHADKKDAPSGTALATAKLINETRLPHQTNTDEVETLANVRGGDYKGIKIHSVRLPGYIAHEEVLFGGPGEALTIRQDSFDRASFMSGVKVALEKVDELSKLVIGLEKIL